MELSSQGRIAAGVLLCLLCSLDAARAQDEESFSNACGLEPPGAVYVPLPGPRPQETRWSASEPPLVRREDRSSGVFAQSGVPQTRPRAGALSGKTLYLSPGHGFYRDAMLGHWNTQRPTTQGIIEDLVSIETLDQYLLPMLMGAGATVIPVREADLNPRMVIVNNGDGGYHEEGPADLFSTSKRVGWGPPPMPLGNAVQPFTLGGSRLLIAAPTASASATWLPHVPADGFYTVYVTYSAYSGRVSDAHYVVRHAGGESHFRVNQRHHGGTWVLLGRFYFHAGEHPETASVQVLNDSADPGTLSLDAVRWGGGTGAIGDATLAPLPRGRAEECARYYTQFSGAPPSVFAPSGTNALANERNDDVSARPRFASWLHEDGEDALYVAWHTNAYDGTVRGTEGYVYGPNPVDGTYHFTGVRGSEVLAQGLLDELKADLQREVEPAWTVRKLRSANLGEVNPTHNPEFPSVLVEVAYHDNALDAARLKDPNFRRIAARAFLHGIIKYFAARDHLDVHLPPEPPVALLAHTVSGGTVEVKWAAALDTDGSTASSADTRYRVYQSADGLAWDEGTETDGLSLPLALPAGTERYFRVAAFNAGGESFPSEVVGVRVPEAGKVSEVLVLNAFRRLDESLARVDDLSAYGLDPALRERLEAMNDGTSLRQHGAALAGNTVAFDGATREAITAGLFTPVGYRVLDWFLGEGGAGGAQLGPADESLMSSFVNAGGHLLLSGSHVAATLSAGSADDRAFLGEVLHASLDSSSPTGSVEGPPDGWLAGLSGAVLDDGTHGGAPVGTTDTLLALSGASAVLDYAGTSRVAGVASAAQGQVLFLGIPFEGLISPSRRAWLMGAFLARTGVLASAPPAPPAEDPSPPDAGAPDQWGLETKSDPPPAPYTTPPADVPDPYVVDRLPYIYEKSKGCGCGAEGETGSLAVLLLAGIARRRRS